MREEWTIIKGEPLTPGCRVWYMQGTFKDATRFAAREKADIIRNERTGKSTKIGWE